MEKVERRKGTQSSKALLYEMLVSKIMGRFPGLKGAGELPIGRFIPSRKHKKRSRSASQRKYRMHRKIRNKIAYKSRRINRLRMA